MAARRVSLPGAAELFRRTIPEPETEADQAASRESNGHPVRNAPLSTRRPSGRERHESKITVYLSADELIDLEQVRLVLRGTYGVSADRGRIVREAVAEMLADFDAHGEDSILVRRLRGT